MLMVTLAAVALGVAVDGGQTSGDQFSQLRSLAGTWVGDLDGDGVDEAEVVYRVTSAGNAVHETMFPGTDHEMVNLFHMDGDDLVMTHYCAVGNQPHLRAVAGGEPNVVHFELVSASNVSGPEQSVMGEAVFTLVDENTLREDWKAFVNGELQHGVTFNMHRKDMKAPEGMADFVEYTVVLLRPVEGRAELAEDEASKIQAAHLAHLRSMHEKGMMYAGPFGDHAGGMCVYQGLSQDEVKKLAESDPAVKAGRLTVEVHPWMVPGGLGRGSDGE